MNKWFRVKARYTKQFDDGTLRRVNEEYLVAASSFTEAEARINEELGQIIRGEFNVIKISTADYNDIFDYQDGEPWHNVKISYIAADESKGKKVVQNFLVSARSVNEAFHRTQESLSTLMCDFSIPKVQLSPIVDVFPYKE